MEALAIGIEESMQDEHVQSRVGQVRYLGELLKEWDIPIVEPVGGHASSRARRIYAHIPQFPANTAAELYSTRAFRWRRGIAGRDPDRRSPLSCSGASIRAACTRRR
jgi:tyrosine phenol-lyase